VNVIFGEKKISLFRSAEQFIRLPFDGLLPPRDSLATIVNSSAIGIKIIVDSL
jgi:hypothetical protein